MKVFAAIGIPAMLLCGSVAAISPGSVSQDDAESEVTSSRKTVEDTNESGSVPTAAGALSGIGAEDAKQQNAPLIVHEWGTFTSFSGSDGIKLEFRPLLTSDLPSFVFNRTRQSGAWFGKTSIAAVQRMETPVTYFYTPIERDVSVRVDFPAGLLTEFYPPVRDFAPRRDKNDKRPFDYREGNVRTAPELKDSMIDWGKVHLIPVESLRAHVADEELSRRLGRHLAETMLPGAGVHQHYAAARATDSAIVQVRHKKSDGSSGVFVPSADYFEKFLFYRGVGNFRLPLSLTAESDSMFRLTNAGQLPVTGLFLVSVSGEELRFQRYEQLAASSEIVLTHSENASKLSDLERQVAEALVAEGLYQKEAWAMVATWRDSWFREEGTRLFYIVPRQITDRLLPLKIEPTPDETVRVLVGRMEVMTPEAEQSVLELVENSHRSRARLSGDDKKFQSPVLPQLRQLGRLAEPALVRTQYVAKQAAIKAEAARLISELREQYAAEASD